MSSESGTIPVDAAINVSQRAETSEESTSMAGLTVDVITPTIACEQTTSPTITHVKPTALSSSSTSSARRSSLQSPLCKHPMGCRHSTTSSHNMSYEEEDDSFYDAMDDVIDEMATVGGGPVRSACRLLSDDDNYFFFDTHSRHASEMSDPFRSPRITTTRSAAVSTTPKSTISPLVFSATTAAAAAEAVPEDSSANRPPTVEASATVFQFNLPAENETNLRAKTGSAIHVNENEHQQNASVVSCSSEPAPASVESSSTPAPTLASFNVEIYLNGVTHDPSDLDAAANVGTTEIDNNRSAAEDDGTGEEKKEREEEDEVEVELETPWSFWIDKCFKGSSKHEYEAGLKLIHTFKSVQTFWSVFNNIPDVEALPNCYSYHLMRNTRRPLWEDAENMNGGQWKLKCKKEDTSVVWRELVLAGIGEQLSDCVSPLDDIVGLTVGKRDKNDIIQIWNLDHRHHGRATVCDRLQELVPDVKFSVIFYKAHMLHEAFEGDSNHSNPPMNNHSSNKFSMVTTAVTANVSNGSTYIGSYNYTGAGVLKNNGHMMTNGNISGVNMNINNYSNNNSTNGNSNNMNHFYNLNHYASNNNNASSNKSYGGKYNK